MNNTVLVSSVSSVSLHEKYVLFKLGQQRIRKSSQRVAEFIQSTEFV